MNKEEFAKICKDSGYADAKTVKEYCKNREEFNAQDLIDIWRLSEKRRSYANGENLVNECSHNCKDCERCKWY